VKLANGLLFQEPDTIRRKGINGNSVSIHNVHQRTK
jgi:hypothetical protein